MHFGIKQCLAFDIPCLGSDSSCSGSGSKFSPGGSRSESAASESGSESEPIPARKKVKTASAGNLKGKQPPEVRRSKPNRKSDDPLPDRHGSGGGSSGGKKNRRKSIKDSKFATKYSELLKPVYKYYQAMQFAAHGAHFQWEANHRARCVDMLLDAAKECHNSETYTIFKNAVEAELHGDDGRMPR